MGISTMKTYANNPPVKYSELNTEQKKSAAIKLTENGKIDLETMLETMACKNTYDRIEIFITSPTSVAVKKK